ncbi:hypothetical protein [Halopelagius fulvigenes]|uniref:Uncharacterized protein n=1 Tax=Halopelagius fulvigenes TaxID=1198324 RepID=A0ABD5U1T4_9EURY
MSDQTEAEGESTLRNLVDAIVVLAPFIAYEYFGTSFESAVLALLAMIAFQMLREPPT